MTGLADFVCETANSPGTSTTINLLGAASGPFVTFATRFSSGAKVFYTISDGAALSENGIGTFTAGSPNTLSRDAVLANTAGSTSRLNFTGTVYVFSFLPAAKVVTRDDVWQVISRQAVASVSAVGFALDAAYRRFRLTTEQARTVSSDAVLGLQFSSDGGSTFINTNYAWSASSVDLSGTAATGGSPSDAVIPITPGLTSADNNGFEATSEIFPGNAGATIGVYTRGFGSSSGPSYLSWQGGGTYAAATGAMNYMAITRPDALNFSGTFILEGLPA